jgi:DNA gyrase inhibitor GyrI
MRIGCFFSGLVMALLPISAYATSCTSQAELGSLDRDALSAAAGRVTTAVLAQDFNALQANLLPQEASEWDGIRATVEQAAPLVKDGKFQLRDVYLLDASDQTTKQDTQFFCSNATGSLTVTIRMNELPPGRYAVILADAAGAPLAGQMGLVLAWDGSATQWKLAGLTVRPGVFGGHDGVWYWQRARELAKTDPWSGWFSYDVARYLLLPVDFLVSPNLQKLHQEQSLIAPSPESQLPLSIPDGDRTWKIDAVGLDPVLHEADLGVAYDSTGVTDPAALRTEATAVMSAFLKAHPDIRANFHGLWAYSEKDGKRTPVMELPMKQIP